MDAISYSYADKQAKRIKKFIENPDSKSGIITVPKVIEAGESVTVPAGRIAILPNVKVNGTLNVEGGGEIFIPAGATLSKVVELTGNQMIDGVKTFSSSPIVPTPTTGSQAVNKDYADTKQSKSEISYNANTSSFIPNTLTNGVIIESGSNANGEYIKFADGTMICRNNFLNFVSSSAGQYFYFPIAFYDNRYCMEITYRATGRTTPVTFNYNPLSVSYAHIFSPADGTFNVSYTCIGKWK